MKKVYLFGAALFFGSVMFAQKNLTNVGFQTIQEHNPSQEILSLESDDRAEGDIIVEDNFSSSADWTTPTDANGHVWTIQSTTPAQLTTYMGAMASPTAANGFASFNGVVHLLNSTVSQQDVVLEYAPVINCTSIPGVVVEFHQRYRAFNSDETILEVSGDNGVTWTEYPLNETQVTNAPAIQNKISVNVSLVAGGQSQVKVRFRWRETTGDPDFGSGYGWMIDDFKVIEAWNYELALTSTYLRMGVGSAYPQGLDYYRVPTTQLAPIHFSGKVLNNGGLTQIGTQFGADVDYGAGNVFTGTSATSDIALGMGDSLYATTYFTPASGVGTYTINYSVTQTNSASENDLLDNTKTETFQVTDYLYGRHNNVEVGDIGNVTSNTGLDLKIGNVMEIFEDGVVGAIHIKVTDDASNVDQGIYAEIQKYNAALDVYEYLEATDIHFITSAENGTFIRLNMPYDINVSAGDELLVLACHQGGTTDVRFSTAQGVDELTVLGYTAGATAPFFLSSPSALMIDLDMRSFVSTDDVIENNNISVSQNMPNPFDGNTLITYNLNEASNVTLEIVDVTGKVVATYDEGTRDAGEHNITINGSELAEGIYFYTFTAGEYKVTKRMVVNK